MSQCFVEPVRGSRAWLLAWNGHLLWPSIALGVAAYFSVALWLDRSWDDPRPKGEIVVQLVGPFEPQAKAAFRTVPSSREYGDLAALADDPHIEGDSRSPVVVYENKTPLGPAHSTFAEVSSGHGRFAHWKGFGIIFSSSDGTDPNTNGRRYWAVVGAH